MQLDVVRNEVRNEILCQQKQNDKMKDGQNDEQTDKLNTCGSSTISTCVTDLIGNVQVCLYKFNWWFQGCCPITLLYTREIS